MPSFFHCWFANRLFPHNLIVGTFVCVVLDRMLVRLFVVAHLEWWSHQLISGSFLCCGYLGCAGGLGVSEAGRWELEAKSVSRKKATKVLKCNKTRKHRFIKLVLSRFELGKHSNDLNALPFFRLVGHAKSRNADFWNHSPILKIVFVGNTDEWWPFSLHKSRWKMNCD